MTLGLEKSDAARALISDYLSKQLGRPVEGRLFSNDELSDALAKDAVDFAYITPLAYVKASKGGHVVPLRRALHRGAPSYVSVLFVRDDSPIKTMADLEKTKVAWVQEGSTSGNFVPRAMLRQKQIDPAKYFSEELFMQDHGKVCDAVFFRRADVGATFADVKADGSKTDDAHLAVEGCRASLTADKLSKLRVVYSSDAIPNDLIAVSSQLPKELVAKLSTLIDTLSKQPEGTAVLNDGFHADGFVPAVDGDFNVLRALATLYSDAPAKP